MLSFYNDKEKDETDQSSTPSTVRKATSVTNLTIMDPNKRKSSVKEINFTWKPKYIESKVKYLYLFYDSEMILFFYFSLNQTTETQGMSNRT